MCQKAQWIAQHQISICSIAAKQLLDFKSKLDSLLAWKGAKLSFDLIRSKMDAEASNFTMADLLHNMWKDVETRTVSPNTIIIYKRYVSHLKAALEHHRQMGMEAGSFTAKDYRSIFNRISTTLGRNTANKVAEFMKQAFSIAVADGLLLHNPCKSIKYAAEEVEHISLSKEDIGKIESLKIDNEKLDGVRKLFLLMCYTGVSYADLEKVTPDAILHFGGQKVLAYQRTKGERVGYGKAYPIVGPALEKAFAEGWHHIAIPMNQDLNKEVKMVAALAGLAKPMDISCKVARNTYGQLMIEGGASIESVAAMLGHTNIATTQKHYVRMSLNTVVNEAKRLGM